MSKEKTPPYQTIDQKYRFKRASTNGPPHIEADD